MKDYWRHTRRSQTGNSTEQASVWEACVQLSVLNSLSTKPALQMCSANAKSAANLAWILVGLHGAGRGGVSSEAGLWPSISGIIFSSLGEALHFIISKIFELTLLGIS